MAVTFSPQFGGCHLFTPYLDTAGILGGKDRDRPLFRSTLGKTKRLTDKPLTTKDVCRMVKRRLKDAGLPPHSFRVTGITDLLGQGVPLDDVQSLAGHSRPRTPELYDRRQKKVTRNIVEDTSRRTRQPPKARRAWTCGERAVIALRRGFDRPSVDQREPL